MNLMSEAGQRPGTKRTPKPTYNQVEKVAAKFGGRQQLARLLSISRFTVHDWNTGRPRGGDGLIPPRIVPLIQALARAEGIFLTAEDWLAEKIVREGEEENLPELTLVDFLS